MASRRKQEEKHLQILKKLLLEAGNKQCFECGQRGPTYIDITIGSFVCTSCGGILRGINPPHRVKSISMTTFTPQEITFVQDRGNEFCKNVYLSNYDERSKAKPESRSDTAKLKYFMELKYEHKKWYVSPDQVKRNVINKPKSDTEKSKTPPVQPLQNLMGNNQTTQIKINRAKPSAAAASNSQQHKPVARVAQPPITSNASSGFADFDKVFGSVDSAFGGQSAPPAAMNFNQQPSLFNNQSQTSFNQPQTVLNQQPVNPAFSQSINIMEPMKPFASVASPTANTVTKPHPIANASAGDKYAALADLDFSVNSGSAPSDNQIDTATFSWGSSPSNSQTNQQNAFMQPQHIHATQSQHSNPYQNNFTTNNVPQQQPSWMAPTSNNNMFAAHSTTGLPTTSQNMPKNPFLAPPNTAPPSYQSVQMTQSNTNNTFGSWQPSQPTVPQHNSPQMFSNSNPFAAPVNGTPSAPAQKTGNPFLF